MTSISPEDKFVKNIQDFMNFGESLLTECYEKKITTLNPNGISYAIIFVNEKIKEKGNKWMVEEFIKKTYVDWNKMKKKDHEYFMKKLPELLPILKQSHTDELCKLFVGKDKTGKEYVSDDDRDCLWEYMNSFIKITINYVHYNRKPIKTEDGFKYSQSFLSDFKVKDNAKLFEMELKV